MLAGFTEYLYLRASISFLKTGVHLYRAHIMLMLFGVTEYHYLHASISFLNLTGVHLYRAHIMLIACFLVLAIKTSAHSLVCTHL